MSFPSLNIWGLIFIPIQMFHEMSLAKEKTDFKEEIYNAKKQYRKNKKASPSQNS